MSVDDQERLTDTSDIATRNEEIARASALHSSRRATGPEPTGWCLYCDKRVEHPRRWCDAFCRDFWEMEQ